MALCIDALPSSVTDMAIPSFKDSTNMTTQNVPLNTAFTLQMDGYRPELPVWVWLIHLPRLEVLLWK